MKQITEDSVKRAVLSNCSCFSGIPESKHSSVLDCLHSRYKKFGKGHIIQNISDQAKLTGIVLSGVVELAIYNENGGQININHCSAGDMFGEDTACATKESRAQIKAVTDCEIVFLDFSSLFSTKNPCPFKMKFSTNLLVEFANKMSFLNDKVRILAQKRLRDKVKVYLQTQKIAPDGTIELCFSRNDLAEFLCADRSALSRELGRMREEGILLFEGKHIQILDKSFLA